MMDAEDELLTGVSVLGYGLAAGAGILSTLMLMTLFGGASSGLQSLAYALMATGFSTTALMLTAWTYLIRRRFGDDSDD